jgi:hypothetical protein
MGLLSVPGLAAGQTADDVTKLIERLWKLDSIDLCQFPIKYRPGVEPPLDALDADESAMKLLKNPYEAQGQGKAGATGWYRVSFVVPDKLGRAPLPTNGTLCGIESNVLGSWEIYTYSNGKPAGVGNGLITMSNQSPNNWVSNAGMGVKAGDNITVAILAYPYPLGRGSPEGFALRHLRLRIAGGHTGNRAPFYQQLFGVREKLRTLKGDELAALQGKLKGPLTRLDAIFAAGETGNISAISKAMAEATKDLGEAQKK